MFTVTPLGVGARGRGIGRFVAASLAALGLTALLTTTVFAATGPVGQTLNVSPATVAPGGRVTITGFAPHCTSVTLLSTAFPGPQEFAGVPAVTATSTSTGNFSATVTIPATTHPGSYTISARACGGNLGVIVTLRVASTSVQAPNTGAGIAAAGLASALALVTSGLLLILLPTRRRRLCRTT